MTDYLVVLILGLVAAGAVAFPFLTGPQRYDDAGDLEADIRRYREAVAAGTVCGRCRAANPPGSRYCGECGREL
jgi:ribosomal protein L40E